MDFKTKLRWIVIIVVIAALVILGWRFWDEVWLLFAVVGVLVLIGMVGAFWTWLWEETEDKKENELKSLRAQSLYKTFLYGKQSELPSYNCSNWLILKPGEKCYIATPASVEFSLLHDFENSSELSLEMKLPRGLGIKQTEKATDKFAQSKTEGEHQGTLLVLNVGVAFVSAGKVSLIPASVIGRPVRDRWVVTLVLNNGNENVPFNISGDPNAPFLTQAAIERIARDAELNHENN
jgi:hypothetical protein